MPHSSRDSAGSTDTFDLTGPMTSTAEYLNHAGVGRALSPSIPIPPQRQQQQQASLHTNNAWKRRSLPNTGVYAEYIDRADLDELLALHAARSRNSTNGHALNNTTRPPAVGRSSYHDALLEQQQPLPQQLLPHRDTAMGAAQERARRESPIVAELRTNVIVKDEFTLVTDFSHHLAQRYARSDSAVMVKVDHSACIAMGGNFDPCYIVTITNISSQMGPATNKRNAALIQSFMSDILSVPPDRGVIKFHAMSEENLATNGTTVQGEIERQEKLSADSSSSAVRRAITNAHRKSLPSIKRGNSKPDLAISSIDSLGADELNTALDRRASSTQSVSPTVTITPANVFDSVSSDINRARKGTSPAPDITRGDNGLRMHPVTSNDISRLKDSRLPNGRPKTISADPTVYAEPVRLAALPQRQSFSTSSSHAPAFLRSDPSRSTSRPPPVHTQSAPSSRHAASPPKEGGLQKRDSYYGSTIDTQTAATATSTTKIQRRGTGKSQYSQQTTHEPAANTAKRRSTITATPKLPSPPPVPDTVSTKSLKVGKRKSFLAAFRRSTTTAS